MPVTIRVSLEEDSARGIFRGVSGDSEWLREIWKVEDRAREEKPFELVKGLLASRGPIPAIVLFC